jgi:hypothetical protein
MMLTAIKEILCEAECLSDKSVDRPFNFGPHRAVRWRLRVTWLNLRRLVSMPVLLWRGVNRRTREGELAPERERLCI